MDRSSRVNQAPASSTVFDFLVLGSAAYPWNSEHHHRNVQLQLEPGGINKEMANRVASLIHMVKPVRKQ